MGNQSLSLEIVRGIMMQDAKQKAEIEELQIKLDKMTAALIKIGDKFEGLPPGDIANQCLMEIAGNK